MPVASPSRNESSVIAAITLFVLVAGAWLAYLLRVLIIDVLLAITIASAIAPLAEMLERRSIPRLATVLLVYFGVIALYSVCAVSIAPAVWEQAIALYQHLPSYLAEIMGWYNQLSEMAGENVGAVAVSADDIRGVVINMINHTLDLTAGLVGLILNGILVLFLAAYFVTEAPVIWPTLARWVPVQPREKILSLVEPLGSRMGGYVRGQIMVSLAVAFFLGTGLTLLGVKYSLVLGLLAGLLNLMPFVGSMLTAAFSILVAFNQSLLLAGLTLGLFAVEQWCESNFIVPNLLGSQVQLHPIIVLFAIIIGATLLGVPGALVAVPVASAAIFLAEEFYVKPLPDAGQKQAPETER